MKKGMLATLFLISCLALVSTARAMTVNGLDGQGDLGSHGWLWDGDRLVLDADSGVTKFVIKGSSTDWIDAIGARFYRPDGAPENSFEIEITDGVFTGSFGMNRLDSNLWARVKLTVYGGDFRCTKDPFENYSDHFDDRKYGLPTYFRERDSIWFDSVDIVITGGDFAFDPTAYVPEVIPVVRNGYKWLVGRVNLGFDPAGGEVSVKQLTLKYGDPYGELPVPTREGYRFVGWQVGGEVVSSEDRCFLHESTIAFAQWEEVPPESDLPELFPDRDATPFAGNRTFNGWVRDEDGELEGTLVIKTGKEKKDGTVKPTVTYTPADGGKKQNIKIPVDQYPKTGTGTTLAIPGVGTVRLGGSSVSGVDVNIQAAADLSKDKALKADYNARLAALAGTRTFAIKTDHGYSAFSVVVGKKGKGKLSGTLSNGAKVSASANGALGEKALAIPFAVAKKANAFGFVVWINEDGTAQLSDVRPLVLDGAAHDVTDVVAPSAQHALADGPQVLRFADETQAFSVEGRKWVFPKRQKRLGDADPNPCGVKLTYTAKTGVVKGSFSIQDAETGKAVKYTVNGIVIGSEFYGSAKARGRDSVEVSVGDGAKEGAADCEDECN